MKAPYRFKHSAVFAALMTAAVAPAAFAHTVLEVNTLAEATRAYNNIIIGHACGTTPVIGTSVVFPDPALSTITAGGQPHSGPLTDFVTNWGPSISVVQSRELFADSGVKRGASGNVVGFWAGAGEPLDPGMIGRVPFRVNAVNIAPASCAVSVRFQVAIVDVCQITPVGELKTAGVAGLWTPHNLGTAFDAATSGNAARLTITRNLTTNPLPSSCGNGLAVEVNLSAEQLNRDMPIVVDGTRVWPE